MGGVSRYRGWRDSLECCQEGIPGISGLGGVETPVYGDCHRNAKQHSS